jgi:hypothetical protein
MDKQRYASFRNTIAAGRVWDLAVYGTSFRILSNSLTTNPTVSIDNGPFYEIAAGLGPKKMPPFHQLAFRNPAGSDMELWIAVTEGEIDDSRASFSEEIAVRDIANSLVSGTSIIALPLNFLINNAAAVNKGGGKVGVPVTAQPFATGESITITGTVNYNGAYLVDATSSANEVVITAAYVAETFDGVDDRIGLTTPRSIATSATRKALDIHNHSATYDLWYGDSTLSPAAYKGVPITPGNGLWLPSIAAVYFAAADAAGKTGVRLSYNAHSKT